MQLVNEQAALSWRQAYLKQAQTHPYSTAGLAIAVLAVALLLVVSLWRIAIGDANEALMPGL